ncbi:hypothetical protein FRB95_000945 [Tulasnella sp. JGI-2019a]|nr:hypothetical protein FRB95_000945 [Tulasnella sp. JGI-2019a]
MLQSSSKSQLNISDASPYLYTRRRDLIHLPHLAHVIQHLGENNDVQQEDSDVEMIEVEPPVQKGKRRRGNAVVGGGAAKRTKLDVPHMEEETRHLVFTHTFDMQCTKRFSNPLVERNAVGYGWPVEEALVLDALVEAAHGQDHAFLDLGRVYLIKDSRVGRIFVTTEKRHAGKACEHASLWNHRLIAVPPIISEDVNIEDHGFHPGYANIMEAITELYVDGRVDVDANLSLDYRTKDDDGDLVQDALPYSFRLDIRVSILAPKAFSRSDSENAFEAQRRLLHHLYPFEFDHATSTETDISGFYSCLQPAPDMPAVQKLKVPGLVSELMPFQRRSVLWMLEREGKTINSRGAVVDMDMEEGPLPLFWVEIPKPTESRTGKGREAFWWMNTVTGELADVRPSEDLVPGGILAEEPGLGKTVESIALVLLNMPSPDTLGPSWRSEEMEVDITPIKGTLVVTPPILLKQWADEFQKHAPNLRVLIYDGNTISLGKTIQKAATSSTVKKGSRSKKASKQEPEVKRPTDWKGYVVEFDVVLTTYAVLAKELNIAKAPVKRPRREIATYHADDERFRSPLIVVEWHRVLMDEVQLVGGGKAAEMVSMIPRRSSFAVSGTPAKAHVQDLVGPLRFLRVQPKLLARDRTWQRFLKPGFYSAFVQLFQRYAIRTQKAHAQGLDIPKQTRYLVPISLGMIEQHFYDQLLEDSLRQLGVDSRGIAQYEDWYPDAGVLRAAIKKLRMACIHPQVGALGGQNGGPRALGGAVRPLEDVLNTMAEQNWQLWMTERRSLLNSRITKALLMEKGAEPSRYARSLEILLSVRAETLTMIKELEDVMFKIDEEGSQLISAAQSQDPNALVGASIEEVQESSGVASSSKSKGKGREVDRVETPLRTTPTGMDDLPASAEGEAHRHKRSVMSNRLRDVQVVLHRAEFSLGDLYHYLGKAAEEGEYYAHAEELRRLLLKSTADVATRSIAKLKADIKSNKITQEDLEIEETGRPGLLTARLFQEADDIIGILEEQRVLLWEWRDHIFELLSSKIISDGDDADGQEYQRAVETQAEVECYLQEYAALLADRREVLTLERTALAAYDARETKLRHTKAAARAAAALQDELSAIAAVAVEVDEAANAATINTLKANRKQCRTGHLSKRALKSVMVDLNNLVGKEQEVQIAKDESLRLRRIISQQIALAERLANEQAPLRTAFNARISYFRQLQELSDTVMEVDPGEKTLHEAQDEIITEIGALENSVRLNGARQRFLEYMKNSSSDEANEEARECGICNCEFDVGILLACGHLFCAECLRAWRKKPNGNCCCSCRQRIDDDSSHRISFTNSKDSEKHPLLKDDRNASTIRNAIEYSVIPPSTLDELAKIESFSQQYGAKIQTLIRHLLLIEQKEPGAKSIVFTAFTDSLHILEHALQTNGIPCIRVDANHGKQNAASRFQREAHLRVLLLNGDKESSGLTLTCAKRIMFVEPTVNSGYELQAVSRILRCGQTEETEVYCYYANDTVEKNILDNAARKGTSLYTKENASAPVNLAKSAIMQQEKVEGVTNDKKVLKGDFIAASQQMLEVLFPDMFLDTDDLNMEDVVPSQEMAGSIDTQAGPSRRGARSEEI